MTNFSGRTFCFLGRSGSGKDTQAELLGKFLEKNNYKVTKISTGDQARLLRDKKTIVGRWIKKILDRGELFPDWLTISLWMCVFQNETSEDEIVLFPSSPRLLKEAEVIDELMKGSDRPATIPIYINIDNKEATERLLHRAREDDTLKVIEERLSWFDKEVLPIINTF